MSGTYEPMMDSQNFKKAVFGGFDREDVLEYVDDLSTRYKKEIEKSNSNSRRFEDEKSQLRAEIDDSKANSEKLNAKISELSHNVADLSRERVAQQESIEKLEQVILNQKKEIDRSSQLNITAEKNKYELEQKNKELSDMLAEKAERLEEIEKIGFNAERLISEATARATATLADANNRATYILTDAAKKSQAQMADAQEEAKQIASKANDDAGKFLASLQEDKARMLKELDDLQLDLSEKQKRAGNDADKIILEANKKAEQIIAVAHGKTVAAKAEYAEFAKDVGEVKANMLSLLRGIEKKIDTLDSVFSQKSESVYTPNLEPPTSEKAQENSPTQDHQQENFFRSAANDCK